MLLITRSGVWMLPKEHSICMLLIVSYEMSYTRRENRQAQSRYTSRRKVKSQKRGVDLIHSERRGSSRKDQQKRDGYSMRCVT